MSTLYHWAMDDMHGEEWDSDPEWPMLESVPLF